MSVVRCSGCAFPLVPNEDPCGFCGTPRAAEKPKPEDVLGRQDAAPCGHPGEAVIGDYVRCLRGCDAVVEESPSVQIHGKRVDLILASDVIPDPIEDEPAAPHAAAPWAAPCTHQNTGRVFYILLGWSMTKTVPTGEVTCGQCGEVVPNMATHPPTTINCRSVVPAPCPHLNTIAGPNRTECFDCGEEIA